MSDPPNPSEPPEIPVEVADPVEVEGAEAAAEPSPPPAPAAEDRLSALEKEKKELYERLLRTAADLDNFRKRSRKDVEESRTKGREEILREMLPVIDNLERALTATESAAGGTDAVTQGIKLVLRQFQTAFERFDVRPFTSLGEPFDPARHEAISQLESARYAPGSVAAEMQKGYMIGSRLLRPALVAVAKAPAVHEPANEPPKEAAPEAPAGEAAPASPASGDGGGELTTKDDATSGSASGESRTES